MPLSILATLATLKQQGRAFLRSRFPNAGTNDAQFLGKQANVLAMGMFGLQRTAEAIDRDSPPNSKSSKNGLDTWAFAVGVPKNTGGYGRNDATPASGGIAPVTGTGGTNVLDGQQLVAPDGVTILKLSGSIVIPANGNILAVTPGTAGNLPAGTVLTWISPPAGCDATVTLSSAISGGLDQETDQALLVRILERWQVPPKGGANVDYEGWAEAILGVYAAFIYPRRFGTCSVDLVIVGAGSGAGRIPSAAVRDAVQAAVDKIRPTHVETARVLLPLQLAAQDLSARVRAVLAVGYQWDWDDTAGFTVGAYDAGTAKLTLATDAPQSLIDAVAGGAKPLVQVLTTTVNHSVIPEQRRILSLNGAGSRECFLETAFTIDPTVGDKVYAGSYAAPLLAQGMLDYIDSVGPSRASGMADVVNPWDDLVSIFKLGEAADVLDTDKKTKLLKNVLIGGVTIAVGAGGAAAADYEPPDAFVTAPQLAKAAHVYVTQ